MTPRTGRPQVALLWTALLWGLLWTPGCGYSFGSGLPEAGISTVAIQTVDNQTFRQRLDVELTRVLERTLVASSDLLPAPESSADAVLHVELVDDLERTLVVGRANLDPIREGSLQLTARIRLQSRRDGRVLVERTLVERAEFRDPIGQDLDTARRELLSDLARRIVLALETAF